MNIVISLCPGLNQNDTQVSEKEVKSQVKNVETQ